MRPDPPAIGVVVGKFHPPHHGHVDLIETLRAACTERVWVVVCERPDQVIAGADRAAWLRDALDVEGAPRTTVVVTPDDLPDAPEPWAQRVRQIVGPDRVDAVGVQDSYGPGFAEAMQADLVTVPDAMRDGSELRPARFTSATRIKSDLVRGFAELVPAARAALVRRVVFVGAESAGKSTLTADVAAALGANSVDEYGREYWTGRPVGAAPRTAEFLHIAERQGELEDAAARRAVRPWLLCDTDALVTNVWHERYLGHPSEALGELAAARRPDLYVLCGIEIAWEQDGTRESGGHVREAMQDATRRALAATGVPWVEVRGAPTERVRAVRTAIESHCPLPDLDGPPGSVRIRRAMRTPAPSNDELTTTSTGGTA